MTEPAKSLMDYPASPIATADGIGCLDEYYEREVAPIPAEDADSAARAAVPSEPIRHE